MFAFDKKSPLKHLLIVNLLCDCKYNFAGALKFVNENPLDTSSFKLMKGKTLRKHSLQ